MSSEHADRRGRWLLLVLGTGGYALLTFAWFTLPAYLPSIIEDLGLTGTQAGVLAGAVPLTYVPVALFSGLLIDRVGARLGLGAGIVLFGVGQFGRAFAEGFPSMLALTLVLGVGATGITFGLPKLVSELFPARRVGRASSVYLVGSSAGSAAAFGLGRPLIGPALGGWRPLFVASGVASLAFALLWAVAALRVGEGEYEEESGAISASSIVADVRRVVGHRDLRLLVVVGTSYLLVNHGLQGWLVTLLETRGVEAAIAGQVTSLLVIAHVCGVLAVPALAERWRRRREAIVVCGALCLVGVAGLLATPARPLLLIGPVVVAGLGLGGLAPLIRAIPVDLDGIGPGLTATAVGLIFAVGEIGGFLGPTAIGWLRDLTGSFAPGLVLLAVAGGIAAAAGLAMDDVEG